MGAHILVCFLAYVMWKTLEQWQIGAGLGHYPRKIIDEIKRIQSADVVLPTADGREFRIRCVVQPDREAWLVPNSSTRGFSGRALPATPFGSP